MSHCAYCQHRMPLNAPSRDFCKEECQRAWHAKRVGAPIKPLFSDGIYHVPNTRGHLQ